MHTAKVRKPKAGRRKRRRYRNLGIRTDDPVKLVRVVQAGIESTHLRKFQKVTGLSLEQIAQAANIPQRTLTRRQAEGRLRSDESDRVLRVSRIFDLATDLFEGDVAAAREWLDTPQAGLGGEAPLKFASTGIGAREVENLIVRLEHGVFT